MQKYKSNITTTSGAAVRGAPVLVIDEDGNNAALFLDRAGTVPAPNPLTTGPDGVFYFYAVNGRYSLRTTVEGVTITDDDVVLMMDPEEITVAGPIAEAVAAAQAAATAAGLAVANSGIPGLIAAAQNAVVDANNAVSLSATSANNAAISKTGADSARDAAVAAKNAAEAALDSFDDRYLGAKAVAPATDNDGGALLTGALYWDTALPGMRSWNGSEWVTLPAATKASVGLENVDNTSDANKPISTATQTALDGKAASSHTHAVADVTGLQAALNGKQASLGFTPVQQGGATGQGTNKVYIGWAANGSGLLCQVDSTNFGTSWPISISGRAAQTFQQTAGTSAVRQSGDIGSTFVSWNTDTTVPAMQVDAPRADAAYMLWRATRWGGRHLAAMHVYEEYLRVTMSVGNLNNFIWEGNGNFTATGNVNALSDIRLKTDLTKITDALSKISRLNGYTYTRKDTGERQTGVVAQELQEVLPEAVVDNGEHLAVAYGNIVGLLIEAIKELKAEVDQLKGK